MAARRVVITGLGVVAPNGVGKDAFWRSIIEGRSGISRIERFDVSDLPTQIAGEVKGFDPGEYLMPAKYRHIGFQSKLGMVAAKLALDDAGVVPDPNSSRMASIVGTSNPTYDLIEKEMRTILLASDIQQVDPNILSVVDPFATSCFISQGLNIRGTSRSIVTSCTSGLNCIGQAYADISRGAYDMVLAGSSDSAITRSAFLSFCAAGIMSRRNNEPAKASRPFDARRDGGVLSEGAAIVILEALEHAVSRSATIYAEIAGYSECAFGTNPKDTLKSFVTSMSAALSSAFICAADMDYISAHGPSDPFTDRIETQAIKTVFGKHAFRIPVSSIKAVTGNPQSAAGPMQVIAACLTLQNDLIPPTCNYEVVDPECDLDYVPNHPRRNVPDYILINSHGFNGTDAALILKRPGNEA